MNNEIRMLCWLHANRIGYNGEVKFLKKEDGKLIIGVNDDAEILLTVQQVKQLMAWLLPQATEQSEFGDRSWYP